MFKNVDMKTDITNARSNSKNTQNMISNISQNINNEQVKILKNKFNLTNLQISGFKQNESPTSLQIYNKSPKVSNSQLNSYQIKQRFVMNMASQEMMNEEIHLQYIKKVREIQNKNNLKEINN